MTLLIAFFATYTYLPIPISEEKKTKPIKKQDNHYQKKERLSFNKS